MSSREQATGESASRLIDRRIDELEGWRGETLGRMRALILEADPGIAEEWKWGVPVWSHNGIVCTGEVYKKAVKLTFARGAAVPDPSGLFNSSLEGNVRRAIDIHEGEKVDARAFKTLLKAAVAVNSQSQEKSRAKGKRNFRLRFKAVSRGAVHDSPETNGPGPWLRVPLRGDLGRRLLGAACNPIRTGMHVAGA